MSSNLFSNGEKTLHSDVSLNVGGAHFHEWLVEIRVKDWVHFEKPSRVVAYEEVIAGNEIAARHLGYDSFENRCKYEPIMRRKMQEWNLTPKECCAPDAVAL